ncbi:hypothetical protein B0H16DRAFT_1745416 [Mycena metata]|uniref:Uncharacterized protein n=1 Tax=Mycena metata TaxID=1033252 RepID=A0AAD7H333_9AGAR|nr:hypothetical protein B0H16DRAFT_1745416 [Mycena metata]
MELAWEPDQAEKPPIDGPMRKDFQGASNTFGRGQTFMDTFREDQTAKDLRSRIEILPKGPEWKAMAWQTQYPTKHPLTGYYCDPLECLQYLLRNPLIKDHINFTSFCLWTNTGKLMRIYSEWLSGDVAWNMQEQLPEDATLLGTILTLDKTQLTVMTGHCSACPVLISLADIDPDFQKNAEI